MKKTREKTKIMRMYRKMHHLFLHNHFKLAKIYYFLIRLFFSCELPPSVVLGSGVDLKHGGLGVVLHKDTVVGDNTIIMQGVTIGGKDGLGCPVIGNNCFIGINSCVLGKITVGDNSKIGANSVVLSDVQSNTTVVGAPAKPVGKK